MNPLTDPVIRIVLALVTKFPGLEKVYLYGSRAKGTYTDLSDYDFAFEWRKEQLGSWGSFATLLREMNPTLNSLDLVRFDQIGPELTIRILKEGIVIYDKSKTKL